MSSQEFFGISFAIGLIFLIIFLYPRSKRDPSRLRMVRGGSGGDRSPVVTRGTGGNPRGPLDLMSEETQNAAAGGARMKSLNVMFNYNGHSWDAHEVLGVPAGASPAMVEEAYLKCLKTTDPGSHDFIKAAYQAIRIEARRSS